MLETAILGTEQTVFGPVGLAHSEIVNDICILFEVSLDEIYGSSRAFRISQARFAAYWMLRRTFNWSTPKIARALKLKDHTSVLHGLGRAIELRNDNRLFRERTDNLVTLHQDRSGEVID